MTASTPRTAGSAKAALMSAARAMGAAPAMRVVGYSTGISPVTSVSRCMACSCRAGKTAGAANDGDRTAMRSPRRALAGWRRSCAIRVIEAQGLHVHICPARGAGAGHRGRRVAVMDTRCSHERGARAMPPTHAHFNGSVNLADGESVMREIAARVPSGLRRVPDGETGDRGNWIFFQMQRFLQMPSLVPAGALHGADGDYEQVPSLRLAEGVDPAEVAWPDLGYADAYLGSYATFAALRGDGVIPDGVRFQIEYPTPLASISAYIVPEQQHALLGSYEQAMFADLARLLRAVPPSEVAVQWDVAVEFGILEEAFAPGGAQ